MEEMGPSIWTDERKYELALLLEVDSNYGNDYQVLP
jgi:hypothetical protein